VFLFWVSPDGHVLQNGQNANTTIYTTHDGITSVQLSGVTSSVIGMYTCVAVSTVGSIATATELIVVEKPGRPGKPHIAQMSLNSIRLRWDAPSSSAHVSSKLAVNYIIEFKNLADGKWHVAVPQCTLCTHIIDDLPEDSDFVFRVRAFEIHCGLGEASECSDVVRIAAPKMPNVDTTAEKENLWLTRVVWQDGFDTRYSHIQRLSTGQFYRVEEYMGSKSERCAVKKWLVNKIRTAKQVEQDAIIEVQCLHRLHHPAVCTLLQTFKTSSGEFALVCEYLPERLFDFILKQRINATADAWRFTERRWSLIAWQLLDVLNYMHSNKIVHLNIKVRSLHKNRQTMQILQYMHMQLKKFTAKKLEVAVKKLRANSFVATAF
jgi:hypothetical protein